MCGKCCFVNQPAANALGDFSCSDCSQDTSMNGLKEWFMINKDLWRSVAKDDEILCVGCLEKRLGRRLSFIDFGAYPVNFDGLFEQSERLQDRIFGSSFLGPSQGPEVLFL